MLDLTKPVITRDGRPARIICKDRKDSDGCTIVALVTRASGQEVCRFYTPEGSLAQADPEMDLINPKKKLYLLVWIPKNDTLPRSGVYLKEDDFKTNKSACVAMGWPILKEEILEVDI